MPFNLNTADVLRYGLLLGLGIVGYLLILTWSGDYAGPRTTQPSTDAQDPNSPNLDPEGLAIPSQPSATSDLPDESMVTSEQEIPVRGVVETNLPTSDRLVVVETPLIRAAIDRYGGDIVQTSLLKYKADIESSDTPVVLLDRSAHKTYVAQSGLEGIDQDSGRPLFNVSKNNYILEEGQLELLLSYSEGGLEIEKMFSFDAAEYVVPVSYRIQNHGTDSINTRLFVQIKRDSSPVENRGAGFFAPRAYLGAALTTDDSRYKKVSFEDVEASNFSSVVTGGWIALLQHYFISAWIADDDQRYDYFGRLGTDGIYRFGFIGPQTLIGAQQEARLSAKFYAGPKDQGSLREIAENLNLTIDYGWFWWLSVPLFVILNFIQDYVYNWGLAIILLTVVIKLALWPLAATSYKSMAKLRKVTPQMKRLQERFADDSGKLRQAMMELYQKEKVNPLQGCLPMLLQMPVFIALYWVLYESVELRHAPFFGWIQDLSSYDPFYVLPILMGASMFAAQALNPPAPNPTQQRMMQLMPVFFTVIMAFFSAGLVLYWLMNNVLSFAQQWWITRRIEKADT